MSSFHERDFSDSGSPFSELVTGDPLARADTDMKYVLDMLATLGGKPVEACLPAQARRQPQLQMALSRLLAKQGKDPLDDPEIVTKDFALPGPTGDMGARLYKSHEVKPRAPMILYIHGGGWVMGDLDMYDASPRALARRTGAIVISIHYRQAPEHKFPAAHDDTYAAWVWLLDNAREFGGDPHRLAVVGEDAGANMALNIALMAKQDRKRLPVHQVLISPMAGQDRTLPSYVENMASRPLNTAMVHWFARHIFANREDMDDMRMNLSKREDLWGLPPATLILAELDPLRSEGEALGAALHRAGVRVDVELYSGVTHDFFGLGQLVNKAMFAQAHVAQALLRSFNRFGT